MRARAAALFASGALLFGACGGGGDGDGEEPAVASRETTTTEAPAAGSGLDREAVEALVRTFCESVGPEFSAAFTGYDVIADSEADGDLTTEDGVVRCEYSPVNPDEAPVDVEITLDVVPIDFEGLQDFLLTCRVLDDEVYGGFAVTHECDETPNAGNADRGILLEGEDWVLYANASFFTGASGNPLPPLPDRARMIDALVEGLFRS